ncbi:amidohydrolase [Anaerobacillus sp. MEB173]|uniref:amidohydrolase n=1 Tax=Anaerobacillus sp. MEB173 TaxID=3383345 RepID=UPI003F92E7B7
MKLLFYNAVIITGNRNAEVINHGYFTVHDGKIHSIASGIPEFSEYDNYTKMNLKGKWVMPGLVNTHSHSGMTLLRGFGDDLPLQQWLQTKMWPMEAKFTRETIQKASSLAILEMLKSGTTTYLDMYIHMDEVAQIVKRTGIRAVLTRGIIGLCPKAEQEEKLLEALTFAKKWNHQAEGRITTMLSPHSPYTCPPEFIADIVTEARAANLPVHTHMSETRREVEENIVRYNKRPVEHLASLGFFDGPALVAHAVHLTDEEITYLAQQNVAISHNPASNLKLGSGIANISKMIDQGLKVSVGTDSVASNNNLDLFQEVRLAALIQKGNTHNPTVLPAREAMKLVTINGADSLFLTNIGSLEVGKAADFITIDASKPHLQPYGEKQIISHLIYSVSGSDVSDVFVDGDCLVKSGECVTIDEEKVVFEANEELKALMNRI